MAARTRVVQRVARCGRYRWKIERTIARLPATGEITIRYERHGEYFADVLRLVAALTCFKRVPTRHALKGSDYSATVRG